jgi:hypothetical protein
MYFGPVRKGLDFLQKDWRYDLLSGKREKLSKGKNAVANDEWFVARD